MGRREMCEVGIELRGRDGMYEVEMNLGKGVECVSLTHVTFHPFLSILSLPLRFHPFSSILSLPHTFHPFPSILYLFHTFHSFPSIPSLPHTFHLVSPILSLPNILHPFAVNSFIKLFLSILSLPNPYSYLTIR